MIVVAAGQCEVAAAHGDVIVAGGRPAFLGDPQVAVAAEGAFLEHVILGLVGNLQDENRGVVFEVVNRRVGLGACDGHVEQAAFLSEIDAVLMLAEDVFQHRVVGDERGEAVDVGVTFEQDDDIRLQTFGLMDGKTADLAAAHCDIDGVVRLVIGKFLAFTCVQSFGILEHGEVEGVARNDGDGLVVRRLQYLLIDGLGEFLLLL